MYMKCVFYIYVLHTGCLLNGGGAKIGNVEEVKENKKVLYHFAVFARVNELLKIAV